MTGISQIAEAKNGVITEEVLHCAQSEGVDIEYIRNKVVQGQIVILKNNRKNNTQAIAIGDGLRIKVNANIGSTDKKSSISTELDKTRIICQSGADALTDLSQGNFIDEIRKEVLAQSTIPVGSNPLFQACQNTLEEHGGIDALTKDALFSQIEKHCKDGVDFIGLHCSVTKNLSEQTKTQKRITGITSNTGSMILRYISMTGKENPLYENFDELLDLIKEYDVVLSLKSALRTACTFDALDKGAYLETLTTADLVKKALQKEVQVMVEVGGFMSLDKIPCAIKTTKELCSNVPVYTQGPIVLDCASGYHDITSAIGATIAAVNGANFICSTTAAEQIGTPNIAQIRGGLIAAKIAAQSVDLANKNPIATEKNMSISTARAEVDLEKEIASSLDKNAYDGIISKK